MPRRRWRPARDEPRRRHPCLTRRTRRPTTPGSRSASAPSTLCPPANSPPSTSSTHRRSGVHQRPPRGRGQGAADVSTTTRLRRDRVVQARPVRERSPAARVHRELPRAAEAVRLHDWLGGGRVETRIPGGAKLTPGTSGGRVTRRLVPRGRPPGGSGFRPSGTVPPPITFTTRFRLASGETVRPVGTHGAYVQLPDFSVSHAAYRESRAHYRGSHTARHLGARDCGKSSSGCRRRRGQGRAQRPSS